MKLAFVVSVELPDWAEDVEHWEAIRTEIEQHAGAAAAFYTRAHHVTARCEIVVPKILAALELGLAAQKHDLEKP